MSNSSYSQDEEETYDYQLPQPLVFGPLIANTRLEYWRQRSLFREYLLAAGIEDDDIDLLDEDFDVDTEPGDADMTIETIKLYMSSVSKSIDHINTSHLTQIPLTDISDEQGQQISALASKFSLDFDFGPKDKFEIIMPDEQEVKYKSCRMSKGISPPMARRIDIGEKDCDYIIITKETSNAPYHLKAGTYWKPIIDEYLGYETGFPDDSDMFPELYSTGQSARAETMSLSSLSQSIESYDLHARSNIRPAGGIVYMHMTGGQLINVGSHNLVLQEDIHIPLRFNRSEEALSELFAAPAGEGLQCSTSSHDLHQMVSAVLSAAMDINDYRLSVNCEDEGMDITYAIQGKGKIAFDITTTFGLSGKLKKNKAVVALSKYDIACVFMKILGGRMSESFAYGVANSLAVEHPAYYRSSLPLNASRDLAIQSQIADVIYQSSQSSITRLSMLSKEAAIQVAIEGMEEIDINVQGQSFKTKNQNLLDAISRLKRPHGIALPILPLTEIVPLPQRVLHFELNGMSICAPSLAQELLFNYQFHVQDNKSFLKHFPVSGIVKYDEAYEIASLLNKDPLHARGQTHPGPKLVDTDIPNFEVVSMASDIYSSLASCQLAEIRSDVARTILRDTAPSEGNWRVKVIYKGKAVMWYSFRDAPNDPRGYRVDWFIGTAFRTLGSKPYPTTEGDTIFISPRQRIRSQELEHAYMAPRRLKLVLLSCLTKIRATNATIDEVIMAIQRLANTVNSATWASGANYIICRHLSASFSAPSAPYDALGKKFKPVKTFACLLFIERVQTILKSWTTRDQYFGRCPLLGLPKNFSQLESYWQVWVPDELADADKHFLDCVMALYDEYDDIRASYAVREIDLMAQLSLITKPIITLKEIKDSIRASTTLDTGGKFGWSVFGTLASAAALSDSGSVKTFDKSFSRGTIARRIVDHLTVRHSMRLDKYNTLQTGTVAEMILEQGLDDYLSMLKPTFSFIYESRPIFFNHPKNGELKDREISIADPYSRMMLNNAEIICGAYGRHTKVDMLKKRDKDAFFYKLSHDCLSLGGAIQSSDASRFSAMMSNISVSILTYALACAGGSAHLFSASMTYRQLAFRRMAIFPSAVQEISKRLSEDREVSDIIKLNKVRDWISSMPVLGHDERGVIKGYCTSIHTGQGMSHHGTSLLHGGGMLLSCEAASRAIIQRGDQIYEVQLNPLVTSDDSTIVSKIPFPNKGSSCPRHYKQMACKIALCLQRYTRKTCLRMVSVLPNLSKEKISGISGEFNSQDNGIGSSCPILGFRELLCELTYPTSPSLIGDYLNANAYGRKMVLLGQGFDIGCYAQQMAIDAIEARWGITEAQRKFLVSCEFLPGSLITGSSVDNILTEPAAIIPGLYRDKLLDLALEESRTRPVYDTYAMESVFSPLTAVRVSMPIQHRKAIQCIQLASLRCKSYSLMHQSLMLDECLSSTLSSARHRNVGRVGFKISHKNFRTCKYGSLTIPGGPMLEITLNWLSSLRSLLLHVESYNDNDILKEVFSNQLCISRIVQFGFPRPILRKHAIGIPSKRPKYILHDYGNTPFGRHAIIRSGGIRIDEIGPEEKEALYLHHASSSYRRVPEHNLYGSSLPLSWIDMSACTIKTRIVSSDFLDMGQAVTYHGLFGEEQIDLLREVEMDNEGTPVLALSHIWGNMAVYHCIYKNVPYSYKETIRDQDVNVIMVNHVFLPGGIPAICVNQGCSKERTWQEPNPTGREIKDFQRGSGKVLECECVEMLAHEMEGGKGVDVPIAAACVSQEGKKLLFQISSRFSRRCPKSFLPNQYAKMISQLALGGYWYASVKGCALRGYMRGLHGVSTVWPTPILGWRMSEGTEPEYGYVAPSGGAVKQISMVKGVDDDSTLSSRDISAFASSSLYIDRSGPHYPDKIINLAATSTNRDIIRCANEGSVLFNEDGLECLFIDAMIPAARPCELVMSKETAVQKLLSMMGDEGDLYQEW